MRNLHKLPEYRSLDEKKEFFTQVRIDTEKDFEDLFKILLPQKFDQGGIWRGLPESRFKLYNSIQREDVSSKKLSTVDDVIVTIKNSAYYLDTWRRNIVSKYFRNYGVDDVPIFAKLSILRHYGVASPLIDWTRDPRVALFFATQKQSCLVNDGINDYFSIYFISTEHPYYKLDSKLGYSEVLKNDTDFKNAIEKRVNFVIEHGGDHFLQMEAREKASREYLQLALNDIEMTLGSIKRQNIQRIEDCPNNEMSHYLRNNLHITAQEGLFIMNSDPFRPLEEAIHYRINKLAQQVDSQTIDVNKAIKINKDNFFCFDIHKRFTDRIILELGKLDFTTYTLEPNFKSLKDDITFGMITEGIKNVKL